MAAGKSQNKQIGKVNRWKDAVAYDIRAKAANWLRFLKRDTAIVTPQEAQQIEATGFVLQYKGKISGARSRVKAVGVQAVVQAIRMKEDVQKTVHAIRNNDWVSVSRLVQPLGTPIDYTPRSHNQKQQQKKVLTNV
jgi:hypothetical protein